MYQSVLEFGRIQRRKVEAEFSGGEITSDGGVLLMRQAGRRINLIDSMTRALGDPRRQAIYDQRLTTLLRQRVFGLALAYEDVNDHDQLRHDGALQTACGGCCCMCCPPAFDGCAIMAFSMAPPSDGWRWCSSCCGCG